jgi:hypothetical protein
MIKFYGPTLSSAARLVINQHLTDHNKVIKDTQDCVIEVVDSEVVIVITDSGWIRPERYRTGIGVYPFITSCVVNGQTYPRDPSPFGLWNEVFEYRRHSCEVDL